MNTTGKLFCYWNKQQLNRKWWFLFFNNKLISKISGEKKNHLTIVCKDPKILRVSKDIFTNKVQGRDREKNKNQWSFQKKQYFLYLCNARSYLEAGNWSKLIFCYEYYKISVILVFISSEPLHNFAILWAQPWDQLTNEDIIKFI